MLQSLLPAEYPFKQVAMDIFLLLTTTTAGYNVIFTVLDKFLKLVKFTPCRIGSSTAELV